MLKNTSSRHLSVKVKLDKKDGELEGNFSTIMRSVRGTKQYWQNTSGDLEALARDFGPATIFMTLSCAAHQTFWSSLSYWASSTSLPISVSKQFSHKFHAMFNIVIVRGELFGKVVCFFIKKEYQQRCTTLPGSPRDEGRPR